VANYHLLRVSSFKRPITAHRQAAARRYWAFKELGGLGALDSLTL